MNSEGTHKGMGKVKQRREKTVKGTLWVHCEQLGLGTTEDPMRNHIKYASQLSYSCGGQVY